VRRWDWQGHGHLSLASGAEYEGGFNSGGLHGKGALHFPSGALYKGEFVDGRMHGAGTLWEAPRQQAQPFTDGRAPFSDQPWAGRQTWSAPSLYDDPRSGGGSSWLSLEQRLRLGTHLPNAARALYARSAPPARPRARAPARPRSVP
jgi:hypothetical protein